MAIQPMALGVATPDTNVMGSFAQGAAMGNDVLDAKRRRTTEDLQQIGSIGLALMGGKLDGQVDPQKYAELLPWAKAQGINIDGITPEMIPQITRASLSTMEQINTAQSEQEIDLRTQELQARLAQLAQGNSPKTGLTPVYGQDADGNTVLLQTTDQGQVIQPKMPDGVTVASGVDRIDLGTNWGLVDKRTGQMVGTLPKDIEGAAAAEEIGTAKGKAAAAAPGDIAAGEMALGLIQQIRDHPELGWATGQGAAWGLNDPRVNPQRAAFQDLVEQVKSGAFMTAIQQMRGLGALSNAEGQTATAAVTRLNTYTDKKSFLAALDDYQAVVEKGIDRARRRVRVDENGNETPTGNANATSGTPSAEDGVVDFTDYFD